MDRIRHRFMPWGGLALGTTGYFIAHQLGSDATFQDCRVGSPWIVIVGTIIGLAVIAVGALASWQIYADHDEGPPRRIVAVVSVMASALFALGVILPFVAALILPRCWQ